MSAPQKPFDFSQFVPGFDFLKNLSSAGKGVGASAPGVSSWVAPTVSVEEVEKRIDELKTVQYWLEQNLNALKATIQALEVQKMTLSTLRGMNVQMEDLAKAFSQGAEAAAKGVGPTAAKPDAAASASAFSFAPPPPAPAASQTEAQPAEPAATSPEPPEAGAGGRSGKSKASAATAPGVIDPLQWWGALTQQFEQIASTAINEAAKMKLPEAGGAGAASGATKKRAAGAFGKGAAARKASGKSVTAKKKGATAKRSATTKRDSR